MKQHVCDHLARQVRRCSRRLNRAALKRERVAESCDFHAGQTLVMQPADVPRCTPHRHVLSISGHACLAGCESFRTW